MQEEALRAAIARNIAFYRRQQGQTQAELAEQLNYSDKSVSKWERGEGVPDIYILARLAEMYGVTVNDLVCLEPPQPRRRPPYLLITLLSLGLVWLVAAVAFFACLLLCPGLPRLYMCFIYALPVCAIVLVVFSALWGNRWLQGGAVSLLLWTLALCVHLTVRQPGVQFIYIIAGVLQALTVLWFLLKSRK